MSQFMRKGYLSYKCSLSRVFTVHRHVVGTLKHQVKMSFLMFVAQIGDCQWDLKNQNLKTIWFLSHVLAR